MEDELNFELAFHEMGDGKKGGGGLTFRYGNLDSIDNFYQKVIVIDAGSLHTGREIVKKIKNSYETEQVDLIINTIPDIRYCQGMKEVINNLQVGEIWMYRPWLHTEEIIGLLKENPADSTETNRKLKEALISLYEIESLALKKGIPIKEPINELSFDNGRFIVSQSAPQDYHHLLINELKYTPMPKEQKSVWKKLFHTITNPAKNASSGTKDKSGAENFAITCTFLEKNANLLFSRGIMELIPQQTNKD